MENKDITQEEAEKWANEELEIIKKDNTNWEEELFKESLSWIIGNHLYFKHPGYRKYKSSDRLEGLDHTDISQDLDPDNPTDLF